MQKDMTRRLVEIGVRSALTQCGGSPGRAVRNLVDLGLTFSRGQLQRQLLTTIQTLLGNPDSAYYPLIRDVVANTDTDRLVRFGVNVGYESCSKGARRLRTVEEEQGFHMPWALGLTVDGSRPAAGLPRWQEVIRQQTRWASTPFCWMPGATPRWPPPCPAAPRNPPLCCF